MPVSLTTAEWTDKPAQWPDLMALLRVKRMFTPTIHQSHVEDWWKCKRYYALRHRFGLVPKGAPEARAPRLGRFYHSFAQDYYLGKDVAYTESRLHREVEQVAEAMEAREAESGVLEAGGNSQTYREQCYRDIQLAKAMLLVFAATYPLDTQRVEVLAVESRMKATLRGLKVPLEGTIDLMIRDKDSEEVWLVDHKTTSRNPLHRASTFSFELQPVIYRVLGEAHLRSVGIPPDRLVGCIHNVLRTPPIQFGREDREYTEVPHVLRSGPRKGETVVRREYTGPPRFDMFLKRVTEWYRGEGQYADAHDRGRAPTLVQSWVRFEKGGVAPDDYAILEEVSRAARALPDPIRYYRQRTGCYAYETKCPYLDLCQSHYSLWPSLVEERFVQEEPTS